MCAKTAAVFAIAIVQAFFDDLQYPPFLFKKVMI